jgi:hypothetical protein
VSIGLGAWRTGMDWQAVVNLADRELYEDKRHRKELKRLTLGQRNSPTIRLGGAAGKRRAAGS